MLPPRPRALVVTAGRARGALAAVRALSRAGWSVGVGTPDGSGMVTASRECAAAHVVARPRGDGAAFVADVRRAVRAGGYDVVFGGGDDWVAALATYRDQVPAVVAHPSAAAVEVALDKVELTRRAAAVGLAAPRTELATEPAVASWSGPVVVKCRAHWHAGQGQQHRIEARRYPSPEAAAGRLRSLRAAGFEAVLQEPVDGGLSALIGLFDGGRLRGRVQQRTTRLWPTPSGVSTRAVTVPVDEELAARASAMLAGWDWSGLVELQFLTGASGVPQLIDVNARFYGSMALALAAGPNLADAWGRQALGLPLPALPDARPGVRFLWTAGDLRRASVERRGGLLADALSTARWFGGATKSVWDRQDPGPTVHLLTDRWRAESAAGSAAAPEPLPAVPVRAAMPFPAPVRPVPTRAERSAR